MIDPLPVTLSKKNFTLEDRGSPAAFAEVLPSLRRAIVTANKVSRFYDDHVKEQKAVGRSAMIMPRDAHQMLQQMRNQKLYLCEAFHNGETAVVAASNLWDYEMPVPSESPESSYKGFASERFLEIGSQVSTLSGFNLQWTLTAVSLVESFLFEPHGLMFAATYGDNKESRENFLNNMRFVQWADVPPTLESVRMHHLREGGLNEFARGVSWFRPSLETLVEAARRIVSLHENPIRTANRRNSGSDAPDRIELTFDREEFKAVPFDGILEASRDIAARAPRTIAELRALAGRAVGTSFIHFPREGDSGSNPPS